MRVLKTMLCVGMGALGAGVAGGVLRADPILFINDYEGFVEAAGDLRTIDFETLPDGSPSVAVTEITPEFNYTDQGVTFSSPRPAMYIVGNPVTGFGLLADSYPSEERNWLVAELVVPAYAVGVFSPGTTLSALDASEGVIASAAYGAAGFVGIVSDVPIFSAVGDAGLPSQRFESFHFTPVPEPGTLGLLALGVGAFIARRRTRGDS